MTLFKFLAQSLEIRMIRRGKTFAPVKHFQKCPDVSQAVQDYVCTTSRIPPILKSERDANKFLHVLEPGVKKIQKQFRLWKWRKDVYWNPHTEIGRAGLLISARAFLSVEKNLLRNDSSFQCK